MSTKLIPFDRLWKVSDVAEFLQMSTSWVYKEAEAGRLPVRRFGFAIRFDPADVRAFARGEWHPTTAVEVLHNMARPQGSRARGR